MPKTAADRGLLFHPEELRFRMLGYYYAALNEDSEFRAQLATVQAPANYDVLEAFAERWHLPVDYGVSDLEASLQWPRRWGGELVLRTAAPRPFDPGHVGVLTERDSALDGVSVRVREWSATIRPVVAAPFAYDPRQRSRAWLRAEADRIAGEVRDSILAQAQTFEDQAHAQGWQRMPPEYRDDERLRSMGRRLYLRAVKGESLKQIARKELVDPSTVSTQVREWAERLKVPIPTRPRNTG